MDALLVKNDLDIIDMIELEGYHHRNVPNFLGKCTINIVSSDGQPIMADFLKQIYK